MLYAGMQATRRAPPQHPLVGRWVHERELPLWLIKAFEEKNRREVAVEAARAAREAAREAARGQATRFKLPILVLPVLQAASEVLLPLSGSFLESDVLGNSIYLDKLVIR